MSDFSNRVCVCVCLIVCFNKMFKRLHLAFYELEMLTWRCPASSILTWVLFFPFSFNSLIRISLKGWHMLVNLCFHIFLTCVIFVGGVTQTRNASVCQAVSQSKKLKWKNFLLEISCFINYKRKIVPLKHFSLAN